MIGSSRFAAVVLLSTTAVSAHAISRVGTRIGDPTDGFWTELPASTRSVEEKDQESLRVFISRVGSYFDDLYPGQETFLEILPFRREYPNWVSTSRLDLKGKLAASEWEKLEANEPCVESWIGRSETASFAIATWGSGTGAVFTGPKSYDLEQYVRALVREITLEPGACAWN